MGLVRGAVRHYCLGGCSALVVFARRSRPFRGAGAGAGCRVPPIFPLPAPRLRRCVWRAVPSGCPLPSLAGTPFHVVSAFRGLGPVAPLVFPVCPLCVCVCARALAVSAPPPSPQGGVARALHAVSVLGAGRAVPRGLCPSACPASVPCSVWLAWGRGRPDAVSSLPGLGLCAPRGVGLRVWRVPAPGVGWVGGGRPAPRSSQRLGRGGQWGGGSPCLGPSLCLPPAGNKAGILGVALAMQGVAPIPLRFVLACCPRARSAGALVCWRGFACPSRFLREQAAGGVEAGPAAAPLPDAAVLPGGGGGGGVRSALGGVGGRRPRGARAGGGLVVGSCRGSPPPPSWGGGLWPSAQSPLCRWRIPPGCTHSAGVVGQPRAPVRPAAGGSAWWWGRGEGVVGGPSGAGGRCASVPPSAFLGRATKRASLAALRSWGPYCSGSLSCPVPGRGPSVVLVRWPGLARLSRPPGE